MKLFTSTVIAVGGGKGGVGKSFFASNLACGLAKNDLKVILVDADLGGANIHLLFGIKYPERTLSDFLQKKVNTFEEVLLPTQLPNLRLICGASDLLEIANPHYAQKQKLIAAIARLDADAIVIDIGAGASLNNLDFFNTADTGIIVTTPSPTSLQNAYGFLKMSVHRRILGLFPHDSPVKQDLTAAFGDNDAFKNMNKIYELLERIDPPGAGQVRSDLNKDRYRLVVNMATTAEGERVAKALGGVAYQFLDIHLASLGAISYDAQVENSIRKMEPLLLLSDTVLSTTFMHMARTLIDKPGSASPNVPQALEQGEGPGIVAKRESSSRVQLCLHDEVQDQGTKLHVQTEDLGLEKAQIVSLVFSGGQILYSRKFDYHDLLEKNDVQHSVAEQVKVQHRDLLDEIRRGLLNTVPANRKGP
jgi:flagellar biosynthesis protein FlhG